MLDGLVNSVPASILIDTGAATSVLNKELWDQAKGSGSDLRGVAVKEACRCPRKATAFVRKRMRSGASCW